MLTGTIFREYDIRGIADQELLNPGIEALGKAIGTYVQRHKGKKIAVGRDVRLSSRRLRDALVQGLTASGCDVTDLGEVPTPLVYYSGIHLGSDGAVMITGSHNPPEFNGFKVAMGSGTLHGAEIQELRRIIEAGDYEEGEGSAESYDITGPYTEEISKQFRFERRIKVVADAGNGVAGPTLRKLMGLLNVELVELFFEMDGTFPNHHPDPTVEENLKHLIDAVREHQADMGIAFDGDSDRLGAVDENGKVIWGDYLMLIFAREILERKPGATFIGEVKCSQVMYDELKRLGGNPIMWKTGHSLIKAKMKETQAALAGEMSGHIFFADRYHGYDDALYAACRLIEIVERSGQPLSAQVAGLPRMVVTPEIRVDCPDELKFAVVKRVSERFQATHDVVTVDGVRVLFEDGWGLVRASNTQPVLVLRFEAKSEELLNRYRREVEGVVEEARQAAETGQAV